MSIATNKAVVMRFNKEFLEAGNIDVLKEIVTDDFVNNTAAETLPNTVEGLILFIKMFHGGFSELRVEIHDMIGEGDLVSTRKTIHAKHTGEIMGHEATGKAVVFNVIDLVRLKDGKYVEHWGQNDIMQVIQGL